MTDNVEPARRGRLVGLDLGSRRIGVAISDPEQRLAVPLKTVDAGSEDGAVRDLGAIAGAEEVTGLVVGLPLSLSGESGEQAERTREFAQRLQKALNLPVAFWDERLSSQEADRMLGSAPEYRRQAGRGRAGAARAPRRDVSAGTGRRPSRGATDALAATIILQAYLDSRRGLRFEEHSP